MTGNLTSISVFAPQALYLATERSKSISRFGRQMASSLADVASVYETFGMLILRAAPPPTSSEYEFSKECYETSRKFAMGERRVAEWYRTKIVDPMQEMLTTNRASIESSNKHYVDSRVDCYKIRKNALTAKTEYVRAVREAEALFVVWKESRKKIPLTATPEEPTAANDNAVLWEVTLRRLGKSVPEVTGRLIQQLKDVVEFQKKYTELVEKENRAVEYSQEAEASALHEFQKAEHGQIDFLLNSLSETIYDTERGTLEKMRLLPHVIDLNQEHVPVTVARRGKNLLENIFQKLSYEEGMGKIDANNLDIPEELGTMRDTVKASIAARESHIKGTQTLADFLDEFSAGALNVATALNMKVQQKDISSPR